MGKIDYILFFSIPAITNHDRLVMDYRSWFIIFIIDFYNNILSIHYRKLRIELTLMYKSIQQSIKAKLLQLYNDYAAQFSITIDLCMDCIKSK